MFKNLLILLLSIFLLFSCSKKDKQEVISKPSEEEIDASISNICRCGTYQRIKEAIKEVLTQNQENG